MHIIFDFDGTIADSFDYVLQYLSLEARREVPLKEDAEAYRKKSMREMAMMLGIPLWRLPVIYFSGRRTMRAHMEKVNAFKGLPEVIKALHEQGNHLYIISANSAKNIRHFLHRYELSHCFNAVKGSSGIFGKINLIKNLRRRFKIKDDVWYIGDELSDIASAKVAGVNVVAVTWGFAEPEAIRRLEPNLVIDKPHELLKLNDIKV
jgi:phosphoglycolate phosphatase